MNLTFSQYSRAFTSRFLIVLAIVLSSDSALQAAMRIHDYAANKHNRFYTGADKDFIGSDFDSTGVGRLPIGDRWATMISDRFFISATHWHPSNGQTLRFYSSNDPNGAFENHLVVGGETIGGAGSDLWLGRLDTKPSSDIARYPILAWENNADYLDQEIHTFGLDFGVSDRSQRLGLNNIDTISGGSVVRTFTYDFDTIGGIGQGESAVEGGDSGAPSFVAIGNQLALVGTHWFKTSNGSGDTFVPNYISGISDALAIWNDELTTIGSIPEPSSIVLLMMGLPMLCRRR